jgi:hypothetical protein
MPDAPVQILPTQAAGSAPAAPVQVAANAGAGSAPAAPVQVASNGSGSTPAAPVQVAANAGAGSAPTSPPGVAGGSEARDPGVVISGTLSPDVTGYLRLVEYDSNGYEVYATAAGPVPESTAWLRLARSGPRWYLNYYPTGANGPREAWRSSAFEISLAGSGGWEPDPDSDGVTTGVPSFDLIHKVDPPVRLEPGTEQLIIEGSLAVGGVPAELPIILLRLAELQGGRPIWTAGGLEVFEGFPTNVFWDDASSMWGFSWYEQGGTYFLSTANVPSPAMVPPGEWDPITNPHAWRQSTSGMGVTGVPVMHVDRRPPPAVTGSAAGSAPASPAQIAPNQSTGSAPTAPPAII